MITTSNQDSSSRELFILTEVAKTLALPLKLPNLLQTVMDRIGEIIDPAEFGYISLFDPTNGLLHPCAFYGQGIQDQEALFGLNLLEGEAVSGIAFNSDKALLFDSPSKIIEVSANLQPQNRTLVNQAFGEDDIKFQSILAAPIRVNEKGSELSFSEHSLIRSHSLKTISNSFKHWQT